jgi:hypothetical protein
MKMKSIKTVFSVFAVFAGPVIFASVSSIAMFSWAPSASAQTPSGMINIDTRNIAKDIAKNINADAKRIPSTVQAPIDVAARVCNVAANVLEDQAKKPGASCTAEKTSAEFDQVVQQQMKGTERK